MSLEVRRREEAELIGRLARGNDIFRIIGPFERRRKRRRRRRAKRRKAEVGKVE